MIMPVTVTPSPSQLAAEARRITVTGVTVPDSQSCYYVTSTRPSWSHHWQQSGECIFCIFNLDLHILHIFAYFAYFGTNLNCTSQSLQVLARPCTSLHIPVRGAQRAEPRPGRERREARGAYGCDSARRGEARARASPRRLGPLGSVGPPGLGRLRLRSAATVGRALCRQVLNASSIRKHQAGFRVIPQGLRIREV